MAVGPAAGFSVDEHLVVLDLGRFAGQTNDAQEIVGAFRVFRIVIHFKSDHLATTGISKVQTDFGNGNSIAFLKSWTHGVIGDRKGYLISQNKDQDEDEYNGQ